MCVQDPAEARSVGSRSPDLPGGCALLCGAGNSTWILRMSSNALHHNVPLTTVFPSPSRAHHQPVPFTTVFPSPSCALHHPLPFITVCPSSCSVGLHTALLHALWTVQMEAARAREGAQQSTHCRAADMCRSQRLYWPTNSL